MTETGDSAMSPLAEVLVVSYSDLQNDPNRDDDVFRSIGRSFGENGTGIIAVRGVPGFPQAKARLLPKAYDLVHLPKEYLDERLTDAGSLYNAGWSLGKEKLGDGEPDWSKGSFYFNPCTDTPGSEEDRKIYPLSYPCNLWPEEEKLPDFQAAAKDLGCILKRVTADFARHLDFFLQENLHSYRPDTLFQAMKETEKVKCRLLYYYPKDQEGGPGNDSWIGWHNDSGFLTALAGEYYLDHATGQILESSGDDQAGLYIADRQDNLHRVVIPDDCMAIQMGECCQILSGGVVCATPHWVRAAGKKNVARISLAAFVDTPPEFPLAAPPGCSKGAVCHSSQQSPRVPPLDKRWTDDGMTFGSFLEKTFQMYYEWKAL